MRNLVKLIAAVILAVVCSITIDAVKPKKSGGNRTTSKTAVSGKKKHRKQATRRDYNYWDYDTVAWMEADTCVKVDSVAIDDYDYNYNWYNTGVIRRNK